jgi:hypothetical protein
MGDWARSLVLHMFTLHYYYERHILFVYKLTFLDLFEAKVYSMEQPILLIYKYKSWLLSYRLMVEITALSFVFAKTMNNDISTKSFGIA